MSSMGLKLFAALLVTVVVVPVTAITKIAANTDVIVGNNGAESSQPVTISQTSTTTVTSNNNAQVATGVSLGANTGSNTIANTTGGNNLITTGNATSNTTVSNDVNHTTVNAAQCCQASANTTQVMGNGAGSTNSVTASTTNTANVTVTNNANVTNQITVNGTTGNNTIVGATADQSGTNSISTGSVRITGLVKNANSNVAAVALNTQVNTTSTIKVVNNGVFSNNDVDFQATNVINVEKNDTANIVNDIFLNGSTGSNIIAHATSGTNEIATGNIDINFTVSNENINSNTVSIGCACETASAPLPPSSRPIGGGETISSGGGSSPSSPSSPGGGGAGPVTPSVLGAAILPITGSAFPYKIVLLAALSFLLTGIALRLATTKLAKATSIVDKRHYRRIRNNLAAN